MSRAYVIENRIDADGRLVGTMRHEWCAPGVSSQFGNPVLEAVPWDGGFARWAAAHARGEPVFGLVADMPEAERTEIEAQDIVSIAEHPVFVGDEWWGAIGFDDCERERRDPSSPCGRGDRARAAVARHRVEHERREAEHRWRQVVEHIPAVTYTDVVVAPDKVRMEFVSPQMRTILGYEPERFIEDPSFWFELIDPEDLARLEASGVLESSDVSRFDEVYRCERPTARSAGSTTRRPRCSGTTATRSLPRLHDRRHRADAGPGARAAGRGAVPAAGGTDPAITYTESIVEPYDAMSAISYLSPQIETVLGYPQRLGGAGFWMQVTTRTIVTKSWPRALVRAPRASPTGRSTA